MRRNSLFPNPLRIIIMIFFILMIVQGLPALFAVGFSGGTPTTAQGGSAAYTAPSSPPRYASQNANSLFDTLKPIALTLLVLFVGRIWFLLEKIATRLERNRMDIALTVKRDDR